MATPAAPVESQAPDTEGSSPSEGGKISLPEIIFFVLWAAISDALEILGDFALAIPVAGIGIWFITEGFGILTSAVIAIWLMLRGGSFGQAKKLITFILGSVFDSLTAGALPLRTISLIVAIWMHNHPNVVPLAGKLIKD